MDVYGEYNYTTEYSLYNYNVKPMNTIDYSYQYHYNHIGIGFINQHHNPNIWQFKRCGYSPKKGE